MNNELSWFPAIAILIPLLILCGAFAILRWIVYPIIMRFFPKEKPISESNKDVVETYIKASLAVRYSKSLLLACISLSIGLFMIKYLPPDDFQFYYGVHSYDAFEIMVVLCNLMPPFAFNLFVVNRHLTIKKRDEIAGNSPRHFLAFWVVCLLPICYFFAYWLSTMAIIISFLCLATMP